MRFLPIAILLLTSLANAQATPSPLTTRFTELLKRAESGHSPAPEELAATADPSQPIPDAASIAEALPTILRALDNKDPQVRMYALLTLETFRSGDSNPVYKSPIARALTPGIPRIAAHLTDDSALNASFTAMILGGFAPNPPATVYPPLIAYLKRDDAVSPLGLSVVIDLLGLGPIPDDAAAAVVRYLRRSDQTDQSRSDLIDAIASQPQQSLAVNAALLPWLENGDASLRARLILSLPLLRLTSEAFADTRARVAMLAQNTSENLQVITAAKAITTCWTAAPTATPCPVYDTAPATAPAK